MATPQYHGDVTTKLSTKLTVEGITIDLPAFRRMSGLREASGYPERNLKAGEWYVWGINYFLATVPRGGLKWKGMKGWEGIGVRLVSVASPVAVINHDADEVMPDDYRYWKAVPAEKVPPQVVAVAKKQR